MGKLLHYHWECHARIVMAGHNEIVFITKSFQVDSNYFLPACSFFFLLLISQMISTTLLNSDNLFRIGLGCKQNSIIYFVKFEILAIDCYFYSWGRPSSDLSRTLLGIQVISSYLIELGKASTVV